MELEKDLKIRSSNHYELCKSEENLRVYTLEPTHIDRECSSLLICEFCDDQLSLDQDGDVHH